jgi:hypothetical protein
MNDALYFLKEAAQDYDKAEITCLVAERKQSRDYFNLLTVIELVPNEQQDSPHIGGTEFPLFIRESIDDFTFYLARIPALPVLEMLSLYANAESGISLNPYGIKANIRTSSTLAQNPPEYHCLFVSPKNERTYGRILPYRPTACRVWSKVNTDKAWLAEFDSKFFAKISALSQKYLGYDLSKIQEHIGNIYLFGCNPLLRSWESSLLDYDRDLLVRFHERAGKSIIGSKLVLEERRGDNPGFYLELPICMVNQRIPLPYFPDVLHYRIVSPNGHLIDHHIGAWRNFLGNVFVQHTEVEYNIKTASGEEIFSVPKRTSEKEINVGSYDLTVAHYLQDALNKRKFEELEASKEFVFFPKRQDSKNKAQQVVRELLNMARKKCVILDPYFGAGDLSYVFRIENVSFPVQIISSAEHLKNRPKSEEASEKGLLIAWRRFVNCIFPRARQKKTKTYAEALHEAIREYKDQFPIQKIECKVLLGSPSPLHDRYIIIDENVYLLGSSLNEFGNRTTTIIRVPAPQIMIEQALTWWEDDQACPSIEDFIEKKQHTDV